MYFATKPSKRPTVSAAERWYAPMISWRSSGPNWVASAVDPTRSQNITVTCRRSADDGGDTGAGGGESAAPAAGAWGGRTARVWPQLAQNLARGGFRWPQDGHASGSDAPHSMQNR